MDRSRGLGRLQCLVGSALRAIRGGLGSRSGLGRRISSLLSSRGSLSRLVCSRTGFLYILSCCTAGSRDEKKSSNARLQTCGKSILHDVSPLMGKLGQNQSAELIRVDLVPSQRIAR